MTTKLVIAVVLGMGIGAMMGYFGKCSSGACPLTANPLRGSIYGGVIGVLFAFSFSGNVSSRERSASVTLQDEVGSVVHVSSVTEFERYVLNADKPCLADFYSDHCGPCRMLAPSIKKLSEKYADRAVICKVSMDSAPELAKPHRITGVPAVLFFNEGKETDRLVGFRDKVEYEKVLDDMMIENESYVKEL